MIPVVRRGWKKFVRNPVVIAMAIAVLVIGGVIAYRVHEHLHDFPGADKARRLLTVAASNRSVLLDPLQTDAGTLGDLFESALKRDALANCGSEEMFPTPFVSCGVVQQ